MNEWTITPVDTTDKLISVYKTAELLDRDPATIRNYAHQGLLAPAVRGGKGRGYMFRYDDVVNFTPPGRGRPTVPPGKYPDIVARYLKGETLQAIGDTYGVTRERIRQIIKENDPSLPAERKIRKQKDKQARQETRAAAILRRNTRLALAEDQHCVVCGGWVLRGANNITCSQECAKAWPVIRNIDEYDLHRTRTAQSTIEHAADWNVPNSKNRIDWANRVLEGDEGPNRRFLVPGSLRAKLAKKYRPEWFREVVEIMLESKAGRYKDYWRKELKDLDE